MAVHEHKRQLGFQQYHLLNRYVFDSTAWPQVETPLSYTIRNNPRYRCMPGISLNQQKSQPFRIGLFDKKHKMNLFLYDNRLTNQLTAALCIEHV
jgi:hypothetical protein